MKKKVLFICNREFDKVYSGAHQCTNRNFETLCDLYGSENVKAINLFDYSGSGFKWLVNRWYNLFIGNYFPLNRKSITVIKSFIDNVQIVFIDMSIYGVLSYKLRKLGYNGLIITFFHNVEIHYYSQVLNKLSPFTYFIKKCLYNNEKNAIIYSDRSIVLNTRDYNLIHKYYYKYATDIIPISMHDSLSVDKLKDNIQLTSHIPNLLFLGSYFFANTEGILRFVKNVFPYVNAKLTIVGSGMSAIKQFVSNDQVTIIDFVEDLNSLMDSADFMIYPIYSGGGMKVKTCEALMYGKNIIGTSESFLGYDIDDFDKIGALCDSDDQFIEVINRFSNTPISKFNFYSRNLFFENYEYNSTKVAFESVFKNM